MKENNILFIWYLHFKKVHKLGIVNLVCDIFFKQALIHPLSIYLSRFYTSFHHVIPQNRLVNVCVCVSGLFFSPFTQCLIQSILPSIQHIYISSLLGYLRHFPMREKFPKIKHCVLHQVKVPITQIMDEQDGVFRDAVVLEL